MRFRTFLCRLGFLAYAAVLAASASADGTWTITPLPGGLSSEAKDINNNGDIIGNVYLENDETRAAMWSGFVMRLLPIVGTYSQACRVNSGGQVVGYAFVEEPTSPNGYAARAILWGERRATMIPTLGGLENFAYGINDYGVVCGHSYATKGSHAFIWTRKGGLIDKGNLNPDYAYAYAGANGINNRGTIVCTAYNLMDPYKAAMARKPEKAIRDISLPGIRNVVSEALSLNDYGVKVGYSSNGKDAGAHAAIFDGKGGYTDLGTFEGMPDSVAADVSNMGDIVGYAYGFKDGVQINAAFLYRGGQMIDLMTMIPKDSGWDTLYGAYGVNDKGQVVGSGSYMGVTRGFVIETNPTAAKP